MDTKFKASNPNSIEMEMSIKMTLKDWKLLKVQLSQEYPSWAVGEQIINMVCDAEKHFYPKYEADND